METIGARIAKYRRAKGMTQEALAEKLGVSSQAVSKWETDASCPDIALLPDLARELGVSVDTLLTGAGEGVRMLPPEQRKSLDELTLRVVVLSAEGDQVRVNLPMALVKICLEGGMKIMPDNAGGSQLFQEVDMNQIVDLVERGAVGKLVDIRSAEGDTVEVVVE